MSASDPITVTPPAELVTLAMARLHLRVDHDADNAVIAGLIAAATRRIEGATNRRLMRQTVRATWDRFPPFDWPGVSSRRWTVDNTALRLPDGLCAAVDWVKYIDATDEQQTLVAGTDYLAHLDRVPAFVYPARGTIWPVTRYGRLGCVSVQYQVGYASRDAVPQDLVFAVLETIAYQYRLRGDAKDNTPAGIPLSVKWVTDYYRLPEYR